MMTTMAVILAAIQLVECPKCDRWMRISEDIILDTARAMATNGLKEAGYRYVNIDDGFFNGHGEDGRITNPYLIAMNQNRGLGVQGYVAQREGEAYVLVKDADERFGRSRYVALYNAGDAEHEFCVKPAALDLGGRVAAFDLVDRSDIGEFEGHVFVKVPAHGARFFRFDAERREERTVYEAETAFLSDYQELQDAVKAGTAFPNQVAWASGGMAVRYLGKRASNDLIWKDVRTMKSGQRTLEFACAAADDRRFRVEIDGEDKGEVLVPATSEVFATFRLEVTLTAGVHRIRLFNPSEWMPDVDRMVLR